MIEFCTGFDGYLATHEWPFYVFESVVIVPIFFLFNIYHPAHYLSHTGWRRTRPAEKPIADTSSNNDGYALVSEERACREMV